MKQIAGPARHPAVVFVVVAGLLLQAAILPAQVPVPQPDGWEPDAAAPAVAQGMPDKAEATVDAGLAGTLIRFYQTDISPNSISRCPFLVSCSNFALRAIESHGVVAGTLLFIDRIYFRENPDAHLFYPMKRDARLFPRLDDTFFLDGEAHDEPAR